MTIDIVFCIVCKRFFSIFQLYKIVSESIHLLLKYSNQNFFLGVLFAEALLLTSLNRINLCTESTFMYVIPLHNSCISQK